MTTTIDPAALDADLAPEPPPGEPHRRPFVSVVVPAYNEALILMESLSALYEYLHELDETYDWEMVVVNDGSLDETGEIADAFARLRPEVRVLHHAVNFQLGQALRYAFNTCQGDYVVTIDCDLSYAPDHIGLLLERLKSDHAKIAVASPYMKGGRTTSIPMFRRILSRGANRFLSVASGGDLSTLTGMVRAYDRPFLTSLSLRSVGTDINTEIVFKAQMLHARIVEVPAHLDWSTQGERGGRESKMRLRSSTSSYMFSGFMFRPVVFFLVPGLLLLALTGYQIGWIGWNTLINWRGISGGLEPRISEAISLTYTERPHAFFIGGISLIASVQLISLGILASQSKRYFEELFNLGTAHLKEQRLARGW